jgi:hypothetical protein
VHSLGILAEPRHGSGDRAMYDVSRGRVVTQIRNRDLGRRWGRRGQGSGVTSRSKLPPPASASWESQGVVWLADAESGKWASHRCRPCNHGVPSSDNGSRRDELEAEFHSSARLGRRRVRDNRRLPASSRCLRGSVGLVSRDVDARSCEGSAATCLRRVSAAAVRDVPALRRAWAALRLPNRFGSAMR